MSEQKANLCDGCSLWPCGSHAPIGVGGCIVTECANRKPTSGEQIATLKAQRDELLELLKWSDDKLGPEINPSNYDHQDVCELNANMVEVSLAIRAAIANAEKDNPEC